MREMVGYDASVTWLLQLSLFPCLQGTRRRSARSRRPRPPLLLLLAVVLAVTGGSWPPGAVANERTNRQNQNLVRTRGVWPQQLSLALERTSSSDTTTGANSSESSGDRSRRKRECTACLSWSAWRRSYTSESHVVAKPAGVQVRNQVHTCRLSTKSIL